MSNQIDIFTVHPNSLEVYKEKVLPTLMGRKLQVLNSIKSLGGEATMWEVSQIMNVPVHTISGRFSELSSDKWKLIEDTGRSKEHHGNNFTIWKVK